MSDESELRHYCRNKQCRSRLKDPTDNPRRAFCTRWCHQSFYRSRCVVCEDQFRRRSSSQKVCGHHECKRELRRFPLAYTFLVPSAQKCAAGSKNPHKTGLITRLKAGRASALQWRASAGRIVGPAHVLAVEVFNRDWRPTVSSGGVPIEVSRLRPRTLMSPR